MNRCGCCAVAVVASASAEASFCQRDSYDLGLADEPVRTALSGLDRIRLDDLRERTAEHADDGRPVTAREEYVQADLVYALRSLGSRDAGNPGTPVFASE